MRRDLREALEKVLSKEEKEHLVTSYDIVGSIAIIDVPKELEKKEKLIADALLRTHKNLKTVCKRVGEHQGKFRIRPVKVIAGEKTTLTEYKESDVKMIVDVNKVYFTPRLSHERERIEEQVKEGETIGVWFAGIGPYALVIARKKKVNITAIELNPEAVKLMRKNISLNKLKGTILPIEGDVKNFDFKFDRIIMPLPKEAPNFLEQAFESINSDGVIHFYSLANNRDLFTDALALVKKSSKGRAFKILHKRVARPYSPAASQIVLDIHVE